MPVIQDPNEQYASAMRLRSILSSGMKGGEGGQARQMRRSGGGNPVSNGVRPVGDNLGQTEYPTATAGTPLGRFIQDMGGMQQKNADLMGRNAQAYQGQLQQAITDFHTELQTAGGDTRKALMNAFMQHPEHFTNEDVFKGVLQYAQNMAAPQSKPMVVGPGGSMYDEQGALLAHNPAAARDVGPGAALVNPETGKPLFQNPTAKDQEGASGTGSKWTLADQRTIEAGTQLLSNASSLRANVGVTGFFTGALRGLQAKDVGAVDDPKAQAWQGALDQSRAAILGLGNNPRLKVASENLLHTLPSTSDSTSFNQNEAIPRHTLSVRNYLADRIAEFKADGKAIPPSFEQQIQQYRADPDYMNSLNTALSNVRNRQGVSPDDIRIIAGEARDKGTLGVPMSDFSSAIQQGRQMGMIDNPTWNAYVQKYPELGQPVQAPAAAAAPQPQAQ